MSIGPQPGKQELAMNVRDKNGNIPTVMIYGGAAGSGKAMKLDEEVLTPTGFVKVRDLRIGEIIYGGDGNHTTISKIYNGSYEDLYRLTFRDGSTIDTNSKHLWYSWKAGSGRKTAKVLETKDLLVQVCNAKRNSLENKRAYWPQIPVTQAVEFPRYDLPIDPYLLGLLLGDGHLKPKKLSLTTGDSEIVEYLSTITEDFTINVKKGTEAVNISFTGDSRVHLNTELEKLGLSGKLSSDKFIPETYKFSCMEDRLNLVRGLLDSDGTVCKRGHPSFCSISKSLATDFKDVLLSLGGLVTITEKEPFYYNSDRKKVKCSTAYICYIKFRNAKKLFKLERKITRVKGARYDLSRAIVDIQKVSENVPMRCISVENEDGLYLQGRALAVTHNSRLLLTKAGYYAYNDPAFEGVMFRRTSPPLRAAGGLFSEAKKLFNPLNARVRDKDMEIIFDKTKGGNLKFTHLEHENDAEGNHQGLQYSFIGFDK